MMPARWNLVDAGPGGGTIGDRVFSFLEQIGIGDEREKTCT
jgi:hypothetical protein